jgi:hypothetical protein
MKRNLRCHAARNDKNMTAIRLVEQLTEEEQRQFTDASLQVRPNTKQRREFAALRQKLHGVRAAESK